jgi:hypothetical protein
MFFLVVIPQGSAFAFANAIAFAFAFAVAIAVSPVFHTSQF